MRYSNDKDINRLVRRLLQSGWKYRQGRHGKLMPPYGGFFITISKTPSDRRALHSIQRDLRRLSRLESHSHSVSQIIKDGEK
jgi:hypothetical protein